MPSTTLKLAMAQMLVEGGKLRENLERAEGMVRDAASEGCGIVVLPDILSAQGRVTLKEFEYWACGKAAVLPRLPALQEIIPEGEASLFFAAGDATDLAARICELLDDDERREEMSRKGQRMVAQRFEWHVLTDRLAQLCEQYIGDAALGGSE